MIFFLFIYTIWHLQSWLCWDKINFLCISVKPKNAFKLLEPSRQELHSSRLGLEPKSITALLSLYAVDGGKFKVPAGQPRKCLDKKCCCSFFFWFFFHGRQVTLNLHAVPAASWLRSAATSGQAAVIRCLGQQANIAQHSSHSD